MSEKDRNLVRRFESFAAAGDGWFWEMDADLRFTYFSPSVYDITGVKPEWHYGKRRDEIGIPESVGEDVWATHLKDLEERRPFRNFVFRREGPDGKKWLRTGGDPVLDANGKFEGYRGIAIDITEETEEAENARSAEALLVSAVQQLSELFVLWDEEGRLVVCNERFREINQEIPEATEPGVLFEDHIRAALAKGLYTAALGREEEWFIERLERHKNPPGPFEQHRQDGRWLLIHEQKLVSGLTVTVSTEITELKRSEQLLRESEERFRDMAESSSDRFWEVDRDYRFTFISDPTDTVMLPRSEELIGKTRWEVGVGNSKEDKMWQDHIAVMNAHDELPLD